ncbi:MAG TPA: FtsX-like permease family protein [Candidatus Dormibacteraeota bacterium]|nr:FtsX-like permease family protein [Candidatus Dormibacteraeota bacterium]
MSPVLAGYAMRALRRRPLATLVQVAAIASALALLASVLLFVTASLAAMTASASAKVALDWQAGAPDAASATSLASRMSQVHGVAAAVPAAIATFTSASNSVPGGGVASSGSGSILAVPPNYLGALHPFHILTGSLSPDGVVVSQPLASTLQAQIGDTIRIQPSANAAAVPVKVTGIAVVDASELIFQPVGGPGPTGTAPPSQVVIAPIGLFEQSLAGAQAVQWEVHAQVERSLLSGGPVEAQLQLATFRHIVERTFPGEVAITDNLDATLAAAAEQALYGQAIFIFVALPGVLIALWLAYYTARTGIEDERRASALLRTRGASRSDILGGAALQGIAIGVIAAAAGVALAVLVTPTQVAFAGASDARRVAAIAAFTFLIGCAAAIGARLAVVFSAHRAELARARARSSRPRPPLWARLYLDLVALGLSAVVFAIDRATGLSAVVNPDSNPTLALSLYSFLAPTLLWIGVTLFMVRFGSRVLAWFARRLPAAGARRSLLPFLIQSTGRRAGPVNRAVILVGLLLSFSVSLSIFSATYDQQSVADARLTLGADVVVNAPTGNVLTADTASRAAASPGVRTVSPMLHSYAYVGADLQDIYGVDPRTVTAATEIRDAYFSGGSAASLLGALATRPDGVLVSAETIKDYGLSPGDLLRLRLLDSSIGRYQVVDFHVVGVVSEFPTAPKDSFLVANLRYVQSATHLSGPNVLLAAASSDPSSVAAAVRSRIADTGATVSDISQQLATTSSSLVAISLGGISRLEEGFAIALALVSVLVFTLLSEIERRRELAIMAAMGSGIRRVATFIWSETAVVVLAAALLSAVLGTALAEMLVMILTHVFDPAPDALAAPWTFFGELALAVIGGCAASAVAATLSVRRADLARALRDG